MAAIVDVDVSCCEVVSAPRSLAGVGDHRHLRARDLRQRRAPTTCGATGSALGAAAFATLAAAGFAAFVGRGRVRHPRDRRQVARRRLPGLEASARRGSPYSSRRSGRAGAPAAIEKRRRRRSVTTVLAPITQRSPIVTPLVTTTLAPHHTLSPMRVGPLVVKPCHGTGQLGVVEAVVAVGDEAAVGEHAVRRRSRPARPRRPSRRG